MSVSNNIIVEVIVWNGVYEKKNPFGHVTTKITKNGINYSFSLEALNNIGPKAVCNTEKFIRLESIEQGVREGFGFVLDITQEQARSIFMTMYTRFHAYSTKSCRYNAINHNCTYAIQLSMAKAGINLHHIISKIPYFQVNGSQTILPAYVEEGLLKTKNNDHWLIQDIIQYQLGKKTGVKIESQKIDLLFSLEAFHSSQGWYTNQKALKGKI
jgi:hypothetical protein